METKVQFCKTSIGPIAQSKADSLMPGSIVNGKPSIQPEETEGDVVFSERLSKLWDNLVNDAFGTAHRPHLLQLLLIFSKIRFW